MSDDNTRDSVMIDLETMATGPNAGVLRGNPEGEPKIG